ncbi:MAG: hypothetical protein WA579_03055 [Rhodomicrobium sp.]
MKTEDDRTIEEHGKRSHEAGFDAEEEAPMTTESEPENGAKTLPCRLNRI